MRYLNRFNEGLKITSQTELEDAILDLVEGDGFSLHAYRTGRWDPDGRNFAADLNRQSAEERYAKKAFSFTLAKQLDKPYISTKEQTNYLSAINKLNRISDRYDYDVYYLIDSKRGQAGPITGANPILVIYVVLVEK